MKIGPLVAAALTAAVIVTRWGRVSVRLRVVAGVAAAGLAVWGAGLVAPPSLETIAADIGAQLGAYTYLVVGILALLETGAGIGLVAPGELAVVIGGVTAGQGHTRLPLLIAVVWCCALAGDLISYWLGRKLGRTFLLRHGYMVRLTPDRLVQVERFLARHGGKTIIVGRFIGLVRAIAPFVAGSSHMPARRFIPATFVAAGVWSATFATLGYLFWQSFDQAAAIAKDGTFALIAVIGMVTVAVVAYRALRRPEARARMWAVMRGALDRPS
ncbi:MAG: DedA family protein [Solirubrobacteraceae bacterium]